MSADDDGDIVTVGTPFPKIKDVSAIASRDHYVLVTWEDDEKPAVVDLAPALHAFKDYAPLRDNRDLFESVHVVDPWTIGWGTDGFLDMHVSELERLSAEQTEKFDFASFLREMELTWDSAALLLGISRRTVAYYAKSREIPRIAALACRYLQERRPSNAEGERSRRRERHELGHTV